MKHNKMMKISLLVSLIFSIVGVALILSDKFVWKDMELAPLGVGLICGALINVPNAVKALKSEKACKEHEIRVKDERNLQIHQKAIVFATTIMLFVLSVMVLVFAFLNLHLVYQLLACILFGYLAIYVVCYIVLRKRM